MRVILTGAGQGGIGGAAALRLARDAQAKGENLKVALCATGKRKELSQLVDQVSALDAEATVLTGDLRDPEVPARLVADAIAFCGGLDCAIANAGLGRNYTLADLSLQDWEFGMQINLRATWLLAKAVYPALKDSHGAFVATGTMAGVYPFAGAGVYGIAKAGLVMLIRTLAQEWAPDGIRVNMVSPGPVRSRLTAAYYAAPGVEESRKKMIPLGKIGEPDDIAGAIAFLAGPDTGFLTGQNIVIDGGLIDSALNTLRRS